MITHLGTLSVGGICPALIAAIAKYESQRLKALADLNAKIAAAAKLTAAASLTLPAIEIGAKIEAAAKVAATIALNVQAPGAQLQLTALAALTASIEAQIAALLPFPFVDAGGIDAYAYAGPVNRFGSELDSAIAAGLPGGGSGTAAASGLALVATSPVAWSALSAVLKTA